jgi:aspartyl-tRNA(Asn)/glutamyl-tRNA(Gln) amidotransferase subunit A
MTRRALLAGTCLPDSSGCFGAGFLSHAGPPTQPHELSIAAAAALIAQRKLSPVELTRAHLDRIGRLNPKLNVFITVIADQALAEARRLEAGKPRGPLHGIPIAVKDLYDTVGVRTTAASKHFRDRVPGADAAVVTRLRQAGAILLGKLNMDEFAYNFTSETSTFGAVHNPWKYGYTPGGSSGGSAAALAAGLAMGTLGSDTGGSIRLPAALCGVAGFKPSYGRLNGEGVLPLAWSLDHPGPMARSARDCRLLAEAMGLDPRRPRPQTARLRIGLPLDPYWRALDPEIESLTRAAVGAIARLCAGARDVRLPEIPRGTDSAAFPNAYSTVIFAEAFAYHRDRIKAEPDLFHPGTRATIELGAPISAAGYIAARRDLDHLRATASRLFAECDLLAMPGAPGPAFPMTGKGDLIFLRNTAPWNLYGLPAISIPCGSTRAGLPAGLQLVAAPGQDHLLLAAAEAFEQTLPAASLARGA